MSVNKDLSFTNTERDVEVDFEGFSWNDPRKMKMPVRKELSFTDTEMDVDIDFEGFSWNNPRNMKMLKTISKRNICPDSRVLPSMDGYLRSIRNSKLPIVLLHRLKLGLPPARRFRNPHACDVTKPRQRMGHKKFSIGKGLKQPPPFEDDGSAFHVTRTNIDSKDINKDFKTNSVKYTRKTCPSNERGLMDSSGNLQKAFVSFMGLNADSSKWKGGQLDSCSQMHRSDATSKSEFCPSELNQQANPHSKADTVSPTEEKCSLGANQNWKVKKNSDVFVDEESHNCISCPLCTSTRCHFNFNSNEKLFKCEDKNGLRKHSLTLGHGSPLGVPSMPSAPLLQGCQHRSLKAHSKENPNEKFEQYEMHDKSNNPNGVNGYGPSVIIAPCQNDLGKQAPPDRYLATASTTLGGNVPPSGLLLEQASAAPSNPLTSENTLTLSLHGKPRTEWSIEEKKEIYWCATYARHLSFPKRGISKRTKDIMLQRKIMSEAKARETPSKRFISIHANILTGTTFIPKPQLLEIEREVEEFLSQTNRSRNIREDWKWNQEMNLFLMECYFIDRILRKKPKTYEPLSLALQYTTIRINDIMVYLFQEKYKAPLSRDQIIKHRNNITIYANSKGPTASRKAKFALPTKAQIEKTEESARVKIQNMSFNHSFVKAVIKFSRCLLPTKKQRSSMPSS